ncbi:hypothetical protein ACTMTI_23575 [Nonomuraea sp. H19]|uniref:hypothetical protein n=1 Tax=Nonomuraea sp. H19 TaxID=3452206 RepID=UPI003F89D2C9
MCVALLNTASYPLPGGGTGTELTIKQDKFRKQFAADVPATTAAIMAATQRPVSTLALEEKAPKPPGRTSAPTL